MADSHRIAVRVHGSIRGTALDSDGAVRLIDDVLSILVQDRDYTARVERIDGVVWEAPTLTLHVGRDVVELTGHPGLQPLAAQILSTALALPEFTRTMRGLGSRRGTVGADHDRFFAGLLAARRAAEGLAEPESRLAAFDSQRLSQGLTTLLGELAAERYPGSGPDRRALEAELLEHAERMYAALETLGQAAEQVRASTPPSRLGHWRQWTSSAQRLFEEADRCWLAVMPALSEAPVPAPRRRFWRRATGMVMLLPAAAEATAAALRAAART